MTTAREWLDAAQARSDAATDGPWERRVAPREGESVEQKTEYLRGTLTDNGEPLSLLIAEPPADSGLAYVVPALTGDGPNAVANAEFIAAARTDVPAMVAALRAVLDLHKPATRATSGSSDPKHAPHTITYCDSCGNDVFGGYPCPTVGRIEQALGGAS